MGTACVKKQRAGLIGEHTWINRPGYWEALGRDGECGKGGGRACSDYLSVF